MMERWGANSATLLIFAMPYVLAYRHLLQHWYHDLLVDDHHRPAECCCCSTRCCSTLAGLGARAHGPGHRHSHFYLFHLRQSVLWVTNGADYGYFPPFQSDVNLNMNHHLGGEYLNIARALAAGEGFANLFGESSGPTAWMPPVLPAILAFLLWVCAGDVDSVTAVIVLLQVCVLSGTGVLVIALAQHTARHMWSSLAAGIYLLTLLCDFFLWFQFTHDGWLTLLILDVLLAGLCWGQPLDRWQSALLWGLFGGLCAF